VNEVINKDKESNNQIKTNRDNSQDKRIRSRNDLNHPSMKRHFMSEVFNTNSLKDLTNNNNLNDNNNLNNFSFSK